MPERLLHLIIGPTYKGRHEMMLLPYQRTLYDIDLNETDKELLQDIKKDREKE
jgi:hypothetical protein